MRAVALGAALLALVGCAGGMTPAEQAQYDRVKCEVAALEPLALADADLVVKNIEAGAVGFDQAIADVQSAKTNVADVKAAFATCRAQFPKLPVGADAGAAP